MTVVDFLVAVKALAASDPAEDTPDEIYARLEAEGDLKGRDVLYATWGTP